MDANDVIENLWNEAITIRAAVAEAYTAVGGPGPLPGSLVQALNYITEHAGCDGSNSTCVSNALLDEIAGAVGTMLAENKITQTENARDAIIIASERAGMIGDALNPTSAPEATLAARVSAALDELQVEYDALGPVYVRGLSGVLDGSTTTGGLAEARAWFEARGNVAETNFDESVGADNIDALGQPEDYSISSILATLLLYAASYNSGQPMDGSVAPPAAPIGFPGFEE